MSEHKKDFTGVFIPAHIWDSSELIPAEKMMLGEIEALSKRNGWCEASRAHFAEWLQCKLPNVSRYFSKLESKGFIEVLRISGYRSRCRVVASRFYTQNDPSLGMTTPVIGNDYPPSLGMTTPVIGNDPKYNNKYKNKNKERKAQAPNSHPQPIEPPSNPLRFGEKEKQPIPFPVPPSQIPLDARPGAKTPGELVAAMRKFYTDYPIEWSDGVLKLAQGIQYSEQKMRDMMTAWSAHQITQNKGGDTFSQLNASFQKWVRNQKDFDRQYGKPAEAAAPTRNDNSKPLPAYVE